jgi:hypothetical protein
LAPRRGRRLCYFGALKPNAFPPLPAAMVSRRIGRLLCREGQRRATRLPNVPVRFGKTSSVTDVSTMSPSLCKHPIVQPPSRPQLSLCGGAFFSTSTIGWAFYAKVEIARSNVSRRGKRKQPEGPLRGGLPICTLGSGSFAKFAVIRAPLSSPLRLRLPQQLRQLRHVSRNRRSISLVVYLRNSSGSFAILAAICAPRRRHLNPR